MGKNVVARCLGVYDSCVITEKPFSLFGNFELKLDGTFNKNSSVAWKVCPLNGSIDEKKIKLT